jgi:uncharacterized protein HemY
MPQAGKVIITTGIILVVAGLIIYFAGNRFAWFGHLPGDIRIEKENMRLYFPITTMLVLSIVASVVFWLIKKLF